MTWTVIETVRVLKSLLGWNLKIFHPFSIPGKHSLYNKVKSHYKIFVLYVNVKSKAQQFIRWWVFGTFRRNHLKRYICDYLCYYIYGIYFINTGAQSALVQSIISWLMRSLLGHNLFSRICRQEFSKLYVMPTLIRKFSIEALLSGHLHESEWN